MRSDVTKARRELGLPVFRSLSEGLEQTISWYRHELQQSRSVFSD
jgi:nucleoside-diphosphate-sugar epimerase